MSNFVFNDINSSELDLIITKPLLRPTWGEVVNDTKIPGKARKYRHGTGVYEDAHFTVNTALMDATPEKVRLVYQKLRGEGILVLPPYIEPNPNFREEYLNVFIEPLVPEAVALLAAEIPIGVTAYPFAYALTPTVLDIKNNVYVSDLEQSPVTVYNETSIYWEPVIEYTPVIGSNDNESSFDVSGSWFTVKTPDEIKTASDPTAYKIVIDSENRICYYVRPSGAMVSCTQNTYGTFPRLRVGASEIMHKGAMVMCRLNEKERWL